MISRLVRKLVIAIVGLSTVAVGVAMILLPGPAFIVIPAGLALLATEFLWAKRLLAYSKERVLRVAESWGSRRHNRPADPATSTPDRDVTRDDT